MKTKTPLLSPVKFASLLLCAGLQTPQTALPSDSTASLTTRGEVNQVIQEYFSSVKSGSALQLRDIFGGPLRAQFDDHLRQPGYPASLMTTYRGASFVLIDTPVVQVDYVEATVVITLKNSERIRERITLTRDPFSQRLLLSNIEGVPLDAVVRSAE